MPVTQVRSIGRDQQGMALLITIMVVSLLIGVTVQFSRSVRHSFFSSSAQLEGQRLNAIARSGLAIGSALLEVDGKTNSYDTLLDGWASIEPEQSADLFPRGEVHFEVEDLSGRFQINGLVTATGDNSPDNIETMVNKNREKAEA